MLVTYLSPRANFSFLFVLFCFGFFFETGCHGVALAGLELTM